MNNLLFFFFFLIHQHQKIKNQKSKNQKINKDGSFGETGPENDSNKPKRKRVTKDMSADEKRKIYLDRNKAAAQKCRQRKKQWLVETQTKSDSLGKKNQELQVQLARLKGEQQILRDHLLTHQICGGEIFTQFLENMKKLEQELINTSSVMEPSGFEISKLPEDPDTDDENDGSDDGN